MSHFQKTLTIIAFVISFIVFPPLAFGFLATGTGVIVASAVAPFLLALLIAITVNVIVFWKRIPKKVLIVLVVIVSLLIVGEIGRQIYLRFTQLQTSNTVEADLDLAVRDDERWQEFVQEAQGEKWDTFVSNVEENSELDTHRRIVYQDGDYCVNPDAAQLSKQSNDDIKSIITENERKILDVSCPTITVKNGVKACGLSWELFRDFDDEEKVRAALGAYGIQDDDKILLLCEFGVTTSHLAFILSHYGYDVMYGALVDLDEELLDTKDGASLADYTVLIDVYKYDPRDQYLYFFINDRDRDLFYEENPTNYRSVIDDFTLINASGLPMEYDQDADLVPRTQNAEAIEDIDVADYKIVCKNKLHCFFTRHFLYFQNIRDVESLYCVSCKEERPIPYCEN